MRIMSGLMRIGRSSPHSPTKATCPLRRVASMQNRCAGTTPAQSSALSTPRPSVRSRIRSSASLSPGSITTSAPSILARSTRYGIDSTPITRAPRYLALTTAPRPTAPRPVIRTVSKASTSIWSNAPNDGPSPQSASDPSSYDTLSGIFGRIHEGLSRYCAYVARPSGEPMNAWTS